MPHVNNGNFPENNFTLLFLRNTKTICGTNVFSCAYQNLIKIQHTATLTENLKWSHLIYNDLKCIQLICILSERTAYRECFLLCRMINHTSLVNI